MSKLDKTKLLSLQHFKEEEVAEPINRKNNEVMGPNKSYAEWFNNLESWRVKKSKDKIIRGGKDRYWCPNYNMEGGFYVMYMNHPANKHDKWAE